MWPGVVETPTQAGLVTEQEGRALLEQGLVYSKLGSRAPGLALGAGNGSLPGGPA